MQLLNILIAALFERSHWTDVCETALYSVRDYRSSAGWIECVFESSYGSRPRTSTSASRYGLRLWKAVPNLAVSHQHAFSEKVCTGSLDVVNIAVLLDIWTTDPFDFSLRPVLRRREQATAVPLVEFQCFTYMEMGTSCRVMSRTTTWLCAG